MRFPFGTSRQVPEDDWSVVGFDLAGRNLDICGIDGKLCLGNGDRKRDLNLLDPLRKDEAGPPATCRGIRRKEYGKGSRPPLEGFHLDYLKLLRPISY